MTTRMVGIVVDGELAMFLRPGLRDGRAQVRSDGVSSLLHVVESIGVPRTEIGSLLVDGEMAGNDYRPSGGESVRVTSRVRPEALSEPRFVLDVHLGTVARRLRLVGVDAAYSRDAADDALIEQANGEERVLLTQDRGLLCRRALWRGAYVRGAAPDAQFGDVLERFRPPLAPWTRCTACNGELAPVHKAEIEPRLRPGTRRTYQSFSRCQSCGQVYWRGAHAKRLDAIVESAAGTGGCRSGQFG